jgi:endonuclease YncB( thermonuclease family)
MRRLAFCSASLSLLLLSCSLLGLVVNPTSQVPTTTPILVSPGPSRSSTMTHFLVSSFTPSETTQPIAETPMLNILSTGMTPDPTLSPFPTNLPLACLPSPSGTEFGQVKWIQDGNTIMVDIQGRLTVVRYLGIQSPDNLPNIQYMGPPAATQNAFLVQGQIVQLIPDSAQRDQNGQLMRYVLLYNTQTFVNYEMLRLGLAQTAANSSSLACYDTFVQIQEQARMAEMGLWAPSPTLFPSATLRPTRTPTPTNTITPTSAFSPTPSSTPGAPTPSPSSTTPTTTGSPQPTSTQTLLPGQSTFTQTPTGIQIINIFYRGTGTNESDEYVEIKNFGSSPVNMLNWWLSAETELKNFTFGQLTLGSGQTCRIYTNQSSGTNWCGNFASSTPVWDNTNDCGELNNPNDEVASTYCYP